MGHPLSHHLGRSDFPRLRLVVGGVTGSRHEVSAWGRASRRERLRRFGDGSVRHDQATICQTGGRSGVGCILDRGALGGAAGTKKPGGVDVEADKPLQRVSPPSIDVDRPGSLADAADPTVGHGLRPLLPMQVALESPQLDCQIGVPLVQPIDLLL